MSDYDRFMQECADYGVTLESGPLPACLDAACFDGGQPAKLSILDIADAGPSNAPKPVLTEPGVA